MSFEDFQARPTGRDFHSQRKSIRKNVVVSRPPPTEKRLKTNVFVECCFLNNVFLSFQDQRSFNVSSQEDVLYAMHFFKKSVFF